MPILGGADKTRGDCLNIVGPVAVRDATTLPVLKLGRDVRLDELRVEAHPAVRGITDHSEGRTLVHDGEIGIEPNQSRILADDVVRETVKRTHAITQAWERTAILNEVRDARGEVVDGGIDERDDQDFLVRLQAPARNDLRCEGREGLCLAGAGNGRNAETAAGVFEDARLGGARGKGEKS